MNIKDIEILLDTKLDEKLEGQRKEYERYVGILNENFQDRLQGVAEMVIGLDEKIDRMDLRLVSIETGIHHIKADLSCKVDRAEFEAKFAH